MSQDFETKFGKSKSNIRKDVEKMWRKHHDVCRVCGGVSMALPDRVIIEIYQYKCYKCGQETNLRYCEHDNKVYCAGKPPYVDYCNYCGANFGMKHCADTIRKQEPKEKVEVEVFEDEKFEVCGRLKRHHTSYWPEAVILVCEDCHNRIHSDRNIDLKPDISREKALEEGYIG